MSLYNITQLDLGFAVLCPDRNSATMKTTVTSIRRRYPDAPVLSVVPLDTPKEEVGEMLQACPVQRGRNTITSLINTALDQSESEWTLVLMAGAYLRTDLHRKYACFMGGCKDILFPIVEGKTNFVDGTMNGILIHRDTWREVGPFQNQESLAVCKMVWANTAINKGCRFKAVLGVPLG